MSGPNAREHDEIPDENRDNLERNRPDTDATTTDVRNALQPVNEQPTEHGFSKIDRKSPEIMEALTLAPIFKKQGRVQARSASVGEQITTVLESGAKETVNTAGEGDYIVTNPSGEQYIISEKKFLARYEAAPEPGVFTAKGFCRAISNPFTGPIEIMASWGSPQTGDENCMIADTCDAAGNLDGEPYLIDGKAFIETYKLATTEE